MTNNKQHNCETLQNQKTEISVQKLDGRDGWYWINWDDKDGNKAYQITHCPYCGSKLIDEIEEDEISLRLKMIKSEQIKDYYNLVSDDEYYTQSNIDFLDKIIEIEKYAEIGYAAEMGQPDDDGCLLFNMLNVEDLLKWFEEL